MPSSRIPPQPTNSPHADTPEFDTYADEYDEALRRGLALAGEDKHYYARGRVAWLRGLLRERGVELRTALDFGCGTGSSIPILLEAFDLASIVGVDVSSRSLAIAAREITDPRASFRALPDYIPAAEVDLAFCNGVFHHIHPAERTQAVDYVWRTLKPGGYFALWENNPWNPGTRIIMNRVAFDRDAIPVSAPEARRLLTHAGFTIERTDFLFIFPRQLRWLRWMEPALSGLPLGGQYVVLARKA